MLDDPWASSGGDDYKYSADFRTCMGNLVGTSNVIYDSTHTFLTGSYVLPDQTRLDQHETIAYSSSGSYHPGAQNSTTWWRPFFTWKDGAIGFFQTVSTDGRTLMAPSYMGDFQSSTNVESGYLKVTVPGLTSLYNTHWLGLYSGTTQLSRSNFVNGTATIDLTGVSWGNYYIEIHFPDDDPLHSTPGTGGELIGRKSITYTQQDVGLAYTWNYGQCLDVELIRDGCSGTTGNVYEPYSTACPQADIILPQYASGRTWAESAYMGLPGLAWQEIVVGDPLMAPYQAHPPVSFVSPSPVDSNRVRGQISLEATAAADGSGNIQRVEFWARGSQISRLIGTDTQAPYECVWDSEAMSGSNRIYPDGNYTIEAIAYQSGSVAGASTVSRSVVLDSAGVSSVNISQPAVDDSLVSVSTPVVAQPNGTPSSVEFWLFGNGNPILAGTGTTCYISSTIASNGVYQLQAVAYYGTPASTSYSSRRRIVLVNDVSAFTTVSALGSEGDNTPLVLANVPVVAGTSGTMSGAFYVEDSNRVAGVRVTTQSSISTGRKVTISGTLHKTGTGITERFLEASQIWDMGECAIPTPVGMPNKSLGGTAPTGMPGITGGLGLYNLGLLVRTCGKVTYVGGDYVYVDDGCGIQDGNTLDGPVVVPLDGGAFRDGNGDLIHRPVTGVKVYLGSLPKPGIDDYVSVTGVCSSASIGANTVRLLRVST